MRRVAVVEAGAGADDGGEWIERLGALLPANCPVIAARLRQRAAVIGFDAAGVLDRELIIQNGVHRLVEDYSGLAQYFLCTIQYAVESDERSIGFFTVGVNASAGSLAPQPASMLRALQENMEDDPAFELPCEPLRKIASALERAARREVRGLIGGFEYTDLRWQDLKEAHVSVGIFGATLRLVAESSSDLALSQNADRTLVYSGLRPEQAQAVYRICQLQDQAWREKLARAVDLIGPGRNRHIRAQSGGSNSRAGDHHHRVGDGRPTVAVDEDGPDDCFYFGIFVDLATDQRG